MSEWTSFSSSIEQGAEITWSSFLPFPILWNINQVINLPPSALNWPLHWSLPFWRSRNTAHRQKPGPCGCTRQPLLHEVLSFQWGPACVLGHQLLLLLLAVLIDDHSFRELEMEPPHFHVLRAHDQRHTTGQYDVPAQHYHNEVRGANHQEPLCGHRHKSEKGGDTQTGGREHTTKWEGPGRLRAGVRWPLTWWTEL